MAAPSGCIELRLEGSSAPRVLRGGSQVACCRSTCSESLEQQFEHSMRRLTGDPRRQGSRGLLGDLEALTSRRFAAATIGPHKTLLGTHALALPLPEREVAPAARFKFAADATPSWMRATVLSLMLTPAPTSSSRMALRFRAPVSKRFESRSEGLRSEDAGRVDSKSPRLLALSQVRKPAWSSLTNSAADIGCGASTISGRPSASIVLAHVASDETE
mmetsp:Transcript_18090/g.62470  ORF Transcript_18090/g.62470 Transcript_18090/m.62470 type:complete len:217 (-) Transcript_18090:70-720(-)